MTALKPLRPHQQRAIDGLKQSLMAGHRRPILQAPTGAGKTVIAAHIVAGALAKHKRVAFVVPALGLIDQTFERFVGNGIDPSQMGVMQGDHHWRRPAAPVQICTAQTLARRYLPDTEVVVVDEAHIRFKIIEQWMALEHMGKVPFIGLTATPWSQGLGKLYDDLIKPTSLAELIELGHLAKFRVFAPSHPDLSGVRTVAGDYHEGDLAERMDREDLVADIVTTWLTRGDNQPTLCFATGRKHAANIHDRFVEAGVAAAYVDANTPREEREVIGRKLASGEIKVVCNIGTLTTGIDWDVRCLILARPTKSESLFVQIIGRALRTAPGKDHAIILDHSDTHARLGMVTDIDFDALDDGRATTKTPRKRSKSMPLPSECPCCQALMPALTRECMTCGHELPERMFAEVDGELIEMGEAIGKAPSARDMIRKLGKDEVFGQLITIQRERGFKPKWADNTYRDIFGVWPRGILALSKEPHPLVRSYVRHKLIRWHKGSTAKPEVRP